MITSRKATYSICFLLIVVELALAASHSGRVYNVVGAVLALAFIGREKA